MSQHLHAALFRQQKARGEGRGGTGNKATQFMLHCLAQKNFLNCDIAELHLVIGFVM